MPRRPKDIDTTVMQAEDFLYLATKVRKAGKRCRTAKQLRNLNGRQPTIEDDVFAHLFEEYMGTVDQLIVSVEVIAHNPLFWSAEIPLTYRAGLAVLLDAPLKPERVKA